MTTTQARPIAEGLFTWPADEPQLIGSTCGGCGNTVFPTAHACARCGLEEMAEVLLPRRGTLWTWTTQDFAPKQPYALADREDFAPYALGYVELPGHVRVEAHLTESDPDLLQIGMDMELVVVPFTQDPDGTEVLTFAFAPVR